MPRLKAPQAMDGSSIIYTILSMACLERIVSACRNNKMRAFRDLHPCVHLHGTAAFFGNDGFQVDLLRMDKRRYDGNGISLRISVHHDDLSLGFCERCYQGGQGLIDGSGFIINRDNDRKFDI